MTEPSAYPARRGALRLAAIVALAIAAGVLMLAATLYLTRRQIAREAVTGWLRERGIASESEFSELGPGRLVGRVRIGRAGAPDLTAERVEVRYSLAGLVAGRGVQVTAIRLDRPVLKAQLRDGRFSVGALDPLIAEFRKRPATPGAPGPSIEIDGGRLLLSTDFGAIDARADALIDQARLIRLDARTAPARLSGPGLAAELGPVVLKSRSKGGVLDVELHAPILRAATGQTADLEKAELSLRLRGGYPDFAKPIPMTASATAELRAELAHAATATARGLSVKAAASRLQWSRTGGNRLAGDLHVAAELHDLAAAQLRLASATGDLRGDVSIGSTSAFRMVGRAQSRGAWTGLGEPVKADSAEIAALKRGLRAFRAAVDGFRLVGDAHGARAALTGPARLQPAGGGELRVVPQGNGYGLTMAGGGLPRAEAQLWRVQFGNDGASLNGTVRAALSIGPLEKAEFAGGGALRVSAGRTSFTGDRCMAVRVAKLELGKNDVEAISTRLCPAGEPLLRLSGGDWTVAGRAEQATAVAPFLQARLDAGQGGMRLSQTGGRLSGTFHITEAAVHDTAAELRFRPLRMSGDAAVTRDVWTGRLAFRSPKGVHIADAVLSSDTPRGAGQVEIATGPLVFAPGALQPADLSPLGETLGTSAQGRVRFTGAFRWTPTGATSDGRLSIERLDFKSPAGPLSGLSGSIAFTSLAPLIAPPGQVLHAEKLAVALPLTDISASLGLQEKSLVVTAGEASAGGGTVRIERLEVPFAKGEATRGAVLVQGVQLHDLVRASPFGDRVELNARVSGRLPFVIAGDKVQIAGGELHAVAPGRLSISRAALASVSAQGSVNAPAAAGPVGGPNTFTDFAYQALENLAFDKLDAQVDTRADGRLGVLFHIVGRHDPPKRQEITISWMDLIRRRFLNRPLPLPSDTGVDLTLDTTLNLDDLLKDYGDFERLRSSPPVQPK